MEFHPLQASPPTMLLILEFIHKDKFASAQVSRTQGPPLLSCRHLVQNNKEQESILVWQKIKRPCKKTQK
jgi:hypothetical protein